MVKSILKRRSTDSVASSCSHSFSPFGSAEESIKQKRVSFDGAEPTRVFEADEWDRSPAAVTLKLTYKDVIELRDLNVHVVRMGPLMMERTTSRKPTQRTPAPRSVQQVDGAPLFHESPLVGTHDESATRFSTVNGSRIIPTYQYNPFPPQSLTPLLEDASSSPNTIPSVLKEHGHLVSYSNSFFPSHSEHLKGLPSPVSSYLPPPTPRSPSPQPHQGSRRRILDPWKPPPLPTLSKRASVPEELALEPGEGTPETVLQKRRLGMSLMGWELRRSGNANGRRGFALVRKDITSV